MNVPWSQLGSAVGGVGLLIAGIAIVARIAGNYHLGAFESLTLFQAGIGLTVAGCFFKLHGSSRR